MRRSLGAGCVVALLVACGDAVMAGPGDTTNPTNGDASPPTTGEGGIELIIDDAGPPLHIDPPEIVDGGPCGVFEEEWRTDDAGAWIPATTWTLTGTGLTLTDQFGYRNGGIFQLDTPSYITHELNPSCHYVIGFSIQIPTSPLAQDLTFMRVTNTNPDATLTFAWSSDADGGTPHAVLSIHLGDKEIVREAAVPQMPVELGSMGVGFVFSSKGSFVMGFSDNSDGEYFVAADASTLGLKELQIGVIDHPTTSPETMQLGVISTDESPVH